MWSRAVTPHYHRFHRSLPVAVPNRMITRITTARSVDRSSVTIVLVMKYFRNRWLPVGAWVFVLYTSIPFVRRLRELFVAHWSPALIGYGVIATVLLATAGALVSMRRSPRPLTAADVVWLLGVGATLVLWTNHLMGQREEAIHFLEYGLLGFLLFRALQPQIQDVSVFLAAALVGVLVGTLDEFIQWIVPGRYWDFRDIVLNAGACVLTLVAVWRLAPRPSATVGARSLRVLCRLAAAEIALLTLCLSATPARIERLTPRLPGLANAAGNTDAICEYGHRHRLDSTTSFRSRLTLDQLTREDTTRAENVAGLLDNSRRAYDKFLDAVSPVADPFSYEARVHLFARDRNLARARKLAPGTPAYEERMTVAFRENLILENFFGETLARSSFQWRKALREKAATAQNREARFISNVAGHLITAVSEPHLRMLMLVALCTLMVCDLLLRRSLTRPQKEQSPAQKGRTRGRIGPGTRG
jgi:hypothetical protein